MTLRTLPAVIAAVSTLAALAAAAPAHAAPPPGAERATFDVTLTGTQVTTWRYVQPPNPDDPCQPRSEGNGDQTIAFRTTSPLRLGAWRRKLSRRRWSPAYLKLERAALAADAERQGELRPLGALPDSCYGDAVGRNADEPGCEDCAPQPPDCGRRDGQMTLTMSFDERVGDGELAGLVRPPRNEIEVAASSRTWRGGALAPLVGGMPLGATYEDCPWWIGGPTAVAEEDGGFIPVLERVAERRLFDTRRRRIVVHGGAERCYAAGGPIACSPRPAGTFHGRTIVAFRLTMIRRAVRTGRRG